MRLANSLPGGTRTTRNDASHHQRWATWRPWVPVVVLVVLVAFEFLEGRQFVRTTTTTTSSETTTRPAAGAEPPPPALPSWHADLFRANDQHDTNHSHSHPYAWLGPSHWAPPPGVPHYTPWQLQRIFARHNTLWVGDSNARQDSITLANLVTRANENLDDVTDAQINQHINDNKAGRQHRKCEHRDFANGTILAKHSNPFSLQCYDVVVVGDDDDDDNNNEALEGHNQTNTTNSSNTINNNTANTTNSSNTTITSPTIPARGRLDYFAMMCPMEFVNIAHDELSHNYTSLLDDYDYLVMDLGIWEITRNRDCQRAAPNTTSSAERLVHTLDALEMIVNATTNGRLRVVYKTTGTQQGFGPNGKKALDALNDAARDWFAQPQRSSRVHLVDWAQQMEPRSDDAHRIHGDLKAHWGWPARLLAVQMVAHQVVVTTSAAGGLAP